MVKDGYEMVMNKVKEVQEFLENFGINTSVDKMEKDVYVVYTSVWHYDIYCEVSQNSENYTLETFNRNTGDFGNLTQRKTLRAVHTYFTKFMDKAWNW